MAAHRYWRWNFTAGNISNARVAEVYVRAYPGGTDLEGNATPSVDSIYGGGSEYPAANTIDNSTATFWLSGNTYPHWLKLDFGAGPAHIGEYAIYGSPDSASQCPTSWVFQYSDNNTDWTTVHTVTSTTWSNAQTKTYPLAVLMPLVSIEVEALAPAFSIATLIPVASVEVEALAPSFLTTPTLSRFAPVYLFPGYTSDGTNITIPIGDLPGLTAAEVHTETGDWREIMQAIMNRSNDYSKVYIDTPLSEQFDSYKIFKKDLYGRTINSYFTVKFLITMCEPNVAPEP